MDHESEDSFEDKGITIQTKIKFDFGDDNCRHLYLRCRKIAFLLKGLGHGGVSLLFTGRNGGDCEIRWQGKFITRLEVYASPITAIGGQIMSPNFGPWCYAWVSGGVMSEGQFDWSKVWDKVVKPAFGRVLKKEIENLSEIFKALDMD